MCLQGLFVSWSRDIATHATGRGARPRGCPLAQTDTSCRDSESEHSNEGLEGNGACLYFRLYALLPTAWLRCHTAWARHSKEHPSPVQKWVGTYGSLASWKITAAASLGQDLTWPSHLESNIQINTWTQERERMRQQRRLIIIIKSLWDTHIRCFVTRVGCIVSVPVELNSKSLAIKSLILILNQIMSLWDLSVRAWVSEK